MASVILRGVSKVYSGKVAAVKDISLEVKDKEFLVLVGPSGCGKTTILRLISGLEELSSGNLFIDSRRVNDVSPKDRDIAMVFQNYALYPHMNVYENMAFGLQLRKIAKPEIKRRVDEASRLLGIESFLSRKPRELSGGQRQRVAMGRAIVREPKVFLMDEPLSNLDAQLRIQMRVELQKLHQKLGITTIYVTHDQTEAMTLGSRIVVMKDGQIQQIDTPLKLYETPANAFVAGFMGNPPMNFLEVTVASKEDELFLKDRDFEIKVPSGKKAGLMNYQGKRILLGIRPENIHIPPLASSSATLKGIVEAVELFGSESHLHFSVAEKSWITRVEPHFRANSGDVIEASLDLNSLHAFEPESGKVIITT